MGAKILLRFRRTIRKQANREIPSEVFIVSVSSFVANGRLIHHTILYAFVHGFPSLLYRRTPFFGMRTKKRTRVSPGSLGSVVFLSADARSQRSPGDFLRACENLCVSSAVKALPRRLDLGIVSASSSDFRLSPTVRQKYVRLQQDSGLRLYLLPFNRDLHGLRASEPIQS